MPVCALLLLASIRLTDCRVHSWCVGRVEMCSMARDEPTVSARWHWSPRSPPPPFPPSATSPAHAAVTRARCVPRAKNRTGACLRSSQPPRAPPAAVAAALARSQPSLQLTDGPSRSVCVASAGVGAANAPPARRRWALHWSPPRRCSARCGVHAPPQVDAGGRGRRQRVQGCEWRARIARGRCGCRQSGR